MIKMQQSPPTMYLEGVEVLVTDYRKMTYEQLKRALDTMSKGMAYVVTPRQYEWLKEDGADLCNIFTFDLEQTFPDVYLRGIQVLARDYRRVHDEQLYQVVGNRPNNRVCAVTPKQYEKLKREGIDLRGVFTFHLEGEGRQFEFCRPKITVPLTRFKRVRGRVRDYRNVPIEWLAELLQWHSVNESCGLTKSQWRYLVMQDVPLGNFPVFIQELEVVSKKEQTND